MSTKPTSTKKPFGILGIGAAACAACCAGPILGFIAATGLLTAGGLALFGTIGLLVAIPGITLIARRRRQPPTCAPSDEPVAVPTPARRLDGVK
jgi:hypothetical protein